MDYSPLANLIINNLYSQMQNFMPQYYGGYVEKEELGSTTCILAYDRYDMLIFGYEFHKDQTGNISAVSCFGQKAKDEYPQIFHSPTNICNGIIAITTHKRNSMSVCTSYRPISGNYPTYCAGKCSIPRSQCRDNCSDCRYSH